MKTAWDMVREKAAVAGRWHDNRHTLITELAESGAGDETIMEIAGHVSRQMLSRYSHIPHGGQEAGAGGSAAEPRGGQGAPEAGAPAGGRQGGNAGEHADAVAAAPMRTSQDYAAWRGRTSDLTRSSH